MTFLICRAFDGELHAYVAHTKTEKTTHTLCGIPLEKNSAGPGQGADPTCEACRRLLKIHAHHEEASEKESRRRQYRVLARILAGDNYVADVFARALLEAYEDGISHGERWPIPF